jgi:uncharacterized repeat protein (TIGR01451 family)
MLLTVTSLADLSIVNSETLPENPVVGDALTSTLNVKNAGPSAVMAARLTNVFPSGATDLAFVTSQGTCLLDGRKLNCWLGRLGCTGHASLSMRFKAATPCLSRSNTTVSGDELDLNLACDISGLKVGPARTTNAPQ